LIYFFLRNKRSVMSKCTDSRAFRILSTRTETIGLYIGFGLSPALSRLLVDRIIGHLKLTFVAERPPPPEVAYLELLMAADLAAEYFS